MDRIKELLFENIALLNETIKQEKVEKAMPTRMFNILFRKNLVRMKKCHLI